MKQILQGAKSMFCAIIGLGDMALEKVQHGMTSLAERGQNRIDAYHQAAQTRSGKRQEQSSQLCLKQLFNAENPQQVLQKAFDSLTDEQYQAVSKALAECQRTADNRQSEAEA